MSRCCKSLLHLAGIAALSQASALTARAGEAHSSPTAAESPARIVAIGDLHGDLAQALAVLQLAGVVDERARWSGGTATLVQTGDVTDRGPDSKEILDLLRRLVDEAATAGGRVIPLLGNHEVMNVQGDWRYVHPGDVTDFGSAEARARAFALDGTYGQWLGARDAVAKVGDTVFVHGGVTEAWARQGVDGINEAVRAALRGGAPEILGSDGPLWYRGYAQDPEDVACPALARALEALEARRMVVGHTTRRDGRILARCNGMLNVIDIGISSAYGGHLGAWEAIDGDARALYATGPSDLLDPVGAEPTPGISGDARAREVRGR